MKATIHFTGTECKQEFVCRRSYMNYSPDQLPQIAQRAGVAHLMVGQQMISGTHVLQHLNLPDDQNHSKKNLINGVVDILTQSPLMIIPDEKIDNFTKLGLEKSPDLRVIVQAS